MAENILTSSASINNKASDEQFCKANLSNIQQNSRYRKNKEKNISLNQNQQQLKPKQKQKYFKQPIQQKQLQPQLNISQQMNKNRSLKNKAAQNMEFKGNCNCQNQPQKPNQKQTFVQFAKQRTLQVSKQGEDQIQQQVQQQIWASCSQQNQYSEHSESQQDDYQHYDHHNSNNNQQLNVYLDDHDKQQLYKAYQDLTQQLTNRKQQSIRVFKTQVQKIYRQKYKMKDLQYQSYLNPYPCSSASTSPAYSPYTYPYYNDQQFSITPIDMQNVIQNTLINICQVHKDIIGDQMRIMLEVNSGEYYYKIQEDKSATGTVSGYFDSFMYPYNSYNKSKGGKNNDVETSSPKTIQNISKGYKYNNGSQCQNQVDSEFSKMINQNQGQNGIQNYPMPRLIVNKNYYNYCVWIIYHHYCSLLQCNKEVCKLAKKFQQNSDNLFFRVYQQIEKKNKMMMQQNTKNKKKSKKKNIGEQSISAIRAYNESQASDDDSGLNMNPHNTNTKLDLNTIQQTKKIISLIQDYQLIKISQLNVLTLLHLIPAAIPKLNEKQLQVKIQYNDQVNKNKNKDKNQNKQQIKTMQKGPNKDNKTNSNNINANKKTENELNNQKTINNKLNKKITKIKSKTKQKNKSQKDSCKTNNNSNVSSNSKTKNQTEQQAQDFNQFCNTFTNDIYQHVCQFQSTINNIIYQSNQNMRKYTLFLHEFRQAIRMLRIRLFGTVTCSKGKKMPKIKTKHEKKILRNINGQCSQCFLQQCQCSFQQQQSQYSQQQEVICICDQCQKKPDSEKYQNLLRIAQNKKANLSNIPKNEGTKIIKNANQNINAGDYNKNVQLAQMRNKEKFIKSNIGNNSTVQLSQKREKQKQKEKEKAKDNKKNYAQKKINQIQKVQPMQKNLKKQDRDKKIGNQKNEVKLNNNSSNINNNSGSNIIISNKRTNINIPATNSKYIQTADKLQSITQISAKVSDKNKLESVKLEVFVRKDKQKKEKDGYNNENDKNNLKLQQINKKKQIENYSINAASKNNSQNNQNNNNCIYHQHSTTSTDAQQQNCKSINNAHSHHGHHQIHIHHNHSHSHSHNQDCQHNKFINKKQQIQNKNNNISINSHTHTLANISQTTITATNRMIGLNNQQLRKRKLPQPFVVLPVQQSSKKKSQEQISMQDVLLEQLRIKGNLQKQVVDEFKHNLNNFITVNLNNFKKMNNLQTNAQGFAELVPNINNSIEFNINQSSKLQTSQISDKNKNNQQLKQFKSLSYKYYKDEQQIAEFKKQLQNQKEKQNQKQKKRLQQIQIERDKVRQIRKQRQKLIQQQKLASLQAKSALTDKNQEKNTFLSSRYNISSSNIPEGHISIKDSYRKFIQNQNYNEITKLKTGNNEQIMDFHEFLMSSNIKNQTEQNDSQDQNQNQQKRIERHQLQQKYIKSSLLQSKTTKFSKRVYQNDINNHESEYIYNLGYVNDKKVNRSHYSLNYYKYESNNYRKSSNMVYERNLDQNEEVETFPDSDNGLCDDPFEQVNKGNIKNYQHMSNDEFDQMYLKKMKFISDQLNNKQDGDGNKGGQINEKKKKKKKNKKKKNANGNKQQGINAQLNDKQAKQKCQDQLNQQKQNLDSRFDAQQKKYHYQLTDKQQQVIKLLSGMKINKQLRSKCYYVMDNEKLNKIKQKVLRDDFFSGNGLQQNVQSSQQSSGLKKNKNNKKKKNINMESNGSSDSDNNINLLIKKPSTKSISNNLDAKVKEQQMIQLKVCDKRMSNMENANNKNQQGNQQKSKKNKGKKNKGR